MNLNHFFQKIPLQFTSIGDFEFAKKPQKYSKANTKFVQEQATITNGLTRDAEFDHLLKTESTANFVGKRVN